MGIWTSKAGLRRRMPLRRVGGSAAVGSSTVGRMAMKYYRLWIYACNTVLLIGAVIFSGAAIRTLLFDYRRSLIPSLTMYQPSFLYAYFALVTQGGALQFLGCLAALRLSEKLLNAYWLLLLVLLFGDILLGGFWVYRFEKLCQELRPVLYIRFRHDYSVNRDLTDLWDRLQSEELCCGIAGPHEFENGTGRIWEMEMPSSCCFEPPPINSTKCAIPHKAGCDERLLTYLKATASLLAILGYCVLTFLKMCFLGILRYEIKEMIQKIRILQLELQLPNVNGTVPSTIRIDSAESERESLLIRPDSTGLLSSPPATTNRNPNGNNNYEMREYRGRENI